MRVLLIAALLLSAGMAVAEAPTASDRPLARPVPVDPLAGFRPMARPVPEAPSIIAEQADLRAFVSSSSAPAEIVASMARDSLTGPLAIGGGDLRPQMRPGEGVEEVIPAVLVRPALRPYVRPDLALGATTRGQLRADLAVFAFSPTAPVASLRPEVRPAAFVRQAEERQAAIVRGQVCGDPAIQGEAIGRVEGPGACGVEGAVRLRSVAGIAVTSQPVVDCRTASALKNWVESAARPAFSDVGGLSRIDVMGGYSCRNRNGAASGKLSEHAHGRAIDIGGFTLANGKQVTVLRDWGSATYGRILSRLHRAACGPFGTVLGPNANAAHRNHFHFDTARYRSGAYCR